MDIRRACTQFYRKARQIIVPNLKYSQAIYEDILWKYTDEKKAWLDLGCGHQLLPPWRSKQEQELLARSNLIVGLDYDILSLKKHQGIKNLVSGNISHLPFVAESFDLVTSNMVFEHLRDPVVQAREIFRILRPGGLLIFHTPNVYGYGLILAKLIPEFLKTKLLWLLQQRKEEDIFPTYYKINTKKMIEYISVNTGFNIKSIRFIVSTPQFILIPPLVVFELFFIRLLMTKYCKPFRTNIIAVLQKPIKNKNNSAGNNMPVYNELFKILACPATQVSVKPLSPDKLVVLNRRISAGAIKYENGCRVDFPLEDALITHDGKIIYKVIDGIPIMLQDEAIYLDQEIIVQ